MPSPSFLFGAALAPIQGELRLWALCDGIGLGDYWRRTGTRPDIWMQAPDAARRFA